MRYRDGQRVSDIVAAMHSLRTPRYDPSFWKVMFRTPVPAEPVDDVQVTVPVTLTAPSGPDVPVAQAANAAAAPTTPNTDITARTDPRSSSTATVLLLSSSTAPPAHAPTPIS